jgi:glutamate-1-semialdehyde 2,1-aminomutase
MGCETYCGEKVTDYRSFQANRDNELSDLAWLYFFNRGILTAPNRDQEWTLSVVHTEEAVDAYLAVFEEMAAELTS